MSRWVKVCTTQDVLENGGSCVLVGSCPVAIFNFDDRREWYAVENVCPHKRQSVLSRGLTGEDNGEPKIACPLHKNAFSLKTGRHLGGREDWQLKTYLVDVRGNDVYIRVEQEGEQDDQAEHS